MFYQYPNVYPKIIVPSHHISKSDWISIVSPLARAHEVELLPTERFGGIFGLPGSSRSRLVEIRGIWYLEILWIIFYFRFFRFMWDWSYILQLFCCMLLCKIRVTSEFLDDYQAENQVVIVNNETCGVKSWVFWKIPSQQHGTHAPQNQARGCFCDNFNLG